MLRDIDRSNRLDSFMGELIESIPSVIGLSFCCHQDDIVAHFTVSDAEAAGFIVHLLL